MLCVEFWCWFFVWFVCVELYDWFVEWMIGVVVKVYIECVLVVVVGCVVYFD